MSDMKTLRVCLSSELPDILHRSSDFIYFAYDKLALYCGQDEVSENFAIATELPEEQVEDMMYILNTDGSVHRKVDYEDTVIATIEDPDQIDILRKAGTLFYVDNNRRYFDSQDRTLTLPFTDGAYELAVAMKEQQKFTNDTIIKYNEDTERFEMYGPDIGDFEDYSKPFRGGETKSVKVKVDGPRITADVKVSSAAGNIIRASSDGLFAKTQNKVDVTTFNKWKSDMDDFKAYAKDVLDKINAEVAELQDLVTPEKISADIQEIVQSRFSTIQTALDNYQAIYNAMGNIETEVMNYCLTAYANEVNKLDAELETNSNWNDLDSSSYTYTEEADYYQKERDAIPEMSQKDIELILAAAAAAAIGAVVIDPNI